MPSCLACGSSHLERWCEAGDAEYRSVPDRFIYWRCRRCDCLSIEPCPASRLREIYPSNYYSYVRNAGSLAESFKLLLDRRLLRSVLRSMPGAELSALDIGGGTGWMLDQARRVEPRLKRTVVLDMDERAARPAVAGGHEFIARRVEQFQAAEQFDLILMFNLIEHVADPVAVLRAVGAMLKPDGVMLLKTPNYDSLDARLFRRSYWGGLHCPRHWVLFTAGSIRPAAARAGLRVVELRLTQGAPFWAWSVLAWLADRGLARVDPARPMYRHPLLPALLAVFAAFDFARRPFMQTSQMFVRLARQPSAGGSGVTGADSRGEPPAVRSR